MKTRERSKREERQMKKTGWGKKEIQQGHFRTQPGSSWTRVSVKQHLQANPDADQNPELQPWAISALLHILRFLSAQVCTITHAGLRQDTLRGHCCMSAMCTSAPSTGTSCLGTMGPEADHSRDSSYRRLRPQHPVCLSASSQSEEDISTATINQQEPCHWHNTILSYGMQMWSTGGFQCSFSPMPF